MKFVYDPEKSASNKEKHGIDFIEAQALWRDYDYIEIPLIFEDEKRFAIIGMIGNKHWTAIITYRNSTVRIIFVRRARKNEVEIYESERI